jgi:peptidoglycan/LPS O-acetylase OafA/YrhL
MAAIIVLVSHVSIFGLYGFEHILANWPPTRLLWAGHQAVILFFVISGFALYLLMWVVAITASIGLAWLFYLAVEQPSKAASRAVRAWFAPPAP